MRKSVVAMVLVLLFALPAAAKDIISLPSSTSFGQDVFRDLSRDLGLAISYYPLAPAASLAGKLVPFGVDAGLEVTAVRLDTGQPQWKLMGTDVPGTLLVPKAHVQAGFKIPFLPPVDLGFVYARIPATAITVVGGEVKIGVLEDGIGRPAVAVRGSLTKLSGLEDTIEMSTRQLDLSVSKRILSAIPYLGCGVVNITSTPKAAPVTTDVPAGFPSLKEEEITGTKIFAGLKLKLGPATIVAEVDKSAVMAYSARFNMSF